MDGPTVATSAAEGRATAATNGQFAGALGAAASARARLFEAEFRRAAWTAASAVSWSNPSPLDAKLNAAYSPYTPLISPDGKTFYFTSVKGAFDNPPIAPMAYASFLEAIRSPGNGLGDIYELPVEALSLRSAQ